MDSPINPTLTTVNPMTAPPLKETFSAWFRPCCAAAQVLPLARNAMLMPTYPAAIEDAAPKTKAIAILQPRPAGIENSRMTAITATTMVRVLYSLWMNASPPSFMASDISLILSEPGFCFRT